MANKLPSTILKGYLGQIKSRLTLERANFIAS